MGSVRSLEIETLEMARPRCRRGHRRRYRDRGGTAAPALARLRRRRDPRPASTSDSRHSTRRPASRPRRCAERSVAAMAAARLAISRRGHHRCGMHLQESDPWESQLPFAHIEGLGPSTMSRSSSSETSSSPDTNVFHREMRCCRSRPRGPMRSVRQPSRSRRSRGDVSHRSACLVPDRPGRFPISTDPPRCGLHPRTPRQT